VVRQAHHERKVRQFKRPPGLDKITQHAQSF
jgi:hypothetical protein